MAKRTLAQVCETLLQVRAQLASGLKMGEACKRAGLTAGTYKRWLEVYAEQALPTYVLPAPMQGVMALSGDGNKLFSVGVVERVYQLVCYDALTGREIARSTFDPKVASHVWLEILHIAANEDGTKLLCATAHGLFFDWDHTTQESVRKTFSLQSLGAALSGRSSSSNSTRPWAKVTIAPDLSHIAVWACQGQDTMHSPTLLRVWRVADDTVVFEQEFPSQSLASAIEFHPTKPLIATLGNNKLICVIDYVHGQTLVEQGPQAHSVSFGPGDTLLYDDWSANIQEFDYTSGAKRPRAREWGSLASQTDRFVTTSEKSVKCWRGAKPNVTHTIGLEGIIETTLARDGRLVVLRADRVCVWDLELPIVTVGQSAL